MTNHRAELVSFMSLRTIHMLYGSISAYLSSQGIWGVISGPTALLVAWSGSRMNIIRIRIISLRRDKTEEDQGKATSTATFIEGENEDE